MIGRRTLNRRWPLAAGSPSVFHRVVILMPENSLILLLLLWKHSRPEQREDDPKRKPKPQIIGHEADGHTARYANSEPSRVERQLLA